MNGCLSVSAQKRERIERMNKLVDFVVPFERDCMLRLGPATVIGSKFHFFALQMLKGSSNSKRDVVEPDANKS